MNLVYILQCAVIASSTWPRSGGAGDGARELVHRLRTVCLCAEHQQSDARVLLYCWRRVAPCGTPSRCVGAWDDDLLLV